MFTETIATVRTGVTISEAAEFLGRSEKTLFNWRKCKFGPQPVRDGNRLLYDRAELAAFRAGVGS